MKNKISAGIAIMFLLVTVAAFAANFTDDQLQFGKPGSSANKEIVFGASNKKKLKHVPGTLTLDYEGNNLSVGDGANTADKTLKLNKGANSPTFRHNFTSGDLEIENAPVLNQKGNTVSVGDGTNTNKILKFNKGASSPEIRYNSSTGKMQFTNDALTYKDIGSGSGGGSGTNLLQDFNFDFEAQNPPQNWTASGGTFAAETSAPMYGLQSGNWDASALNQTLSSQLVTIERGFIGRKCQAEIEYRYASGAAGDISLQAVDQVPNILATVPLELTTGSNTRKAAIAFDCPTTATDQLSLRLIANVANPGAIVVDNAFVGSGRVTTVYNQTKYLGQVETSGATNCSWIFNTNQAVGGTPTADADCNTAVASGEQAQAPATKIPAIVLKQVPAGRLKIQMTGSFRDEANPNGCVWAVFNSTLGQKLVGTMYGQGSHLEATTLVAEYDVPAGGLSNAQFEIRGGTRYAAGQCSIEVQNASFNVFRMGAYSFSTGQSEALNLETTGYVVDTRIGGANPDLGAGAVTSYAEITNGSLTLISKPHSASVGVACSSGNPSVVGATTCAAGSETLGITFNIPYAGLYEVCTSLSPYTTGSSQNSGTFQLAEVPNSGAISILQTGGENISAWSTAAAGADGGGTARVCGRFSFASAGQKTVKALYTKIAAASSTLIIADRSGSLGERDVFFTVRAFNQNFPAPVFTEITDGLKSRAKFPTTPSSQVKHTLVKLGSTCTITREYGSWVASTTNNSAGVCSITINGGVFSVPPICVCSPETSDGSGRRYCAFDSTVHALGFVRFRITNETGAAISTENTSVSCWGE